MTNRTVFLPVLHEDQERAYSHVLANRFSALRCGRRWGKTTLIEVLSGEEACRGHLVGLFAPDYKILSETYHNLVDHLKPIIKRSSQTQGVIRCHGGARLDFWTLDNERAGRSRKYHLALIDEGAFTDKKKMMDIWQKSIRPTLLDYGGKCVVASNSAGADPENFLWRLSNEPEHGFVDFHAPTRNNPHLPAAEVEKLKAENHPLVYAQEYEAEYVDWAGQAFFALPTLLVDDKPLEWPTICDGVFATIDTAVKTGKENDGSAVTFWAVTKNFDGPGIYPLIALDWDLVQIEGALLETWLPTVFEQLEIMARQCRARMGVLGAWIEDKASGMVLLQQARRRDWNAHEIDSKLTSVGKSERAISVSGYVHRGMVKVSRQAFDRVKVYKNASRNHFMHQILSFRVGVKDDGAVQDDLLDTFTYGIAIALGNYEGF